jgi:hypothetical protein
MMKNKIKGKKEEEVKRDADDAKLQINWYVRTKNSRISCGRIT